MRASFYAAYADAMASHGYAVAQYDLPLLKYLQDSTEVALLPGILAWLRQLTAPGGVLSNQLDLSCMGLAGHSRGGKLATLALTGVLVAIASACIKSLPEHALCRAQGILQGCVPD